MELNGESKKVRLLIISLLTYILLIAQQTKVRDIIHIDFPSETVRISNEQLKLMVNDSNNMVLKPALSNTNDEMYKIDSFILKLYPALEFTEELFRRHQENFGGTFKQINCSSCISEIKNVNNYNVLITSIHSQIWGCYFFFSVNKKRNAVLNGSLYYTNNREKAFKTLN